MVRFNPARLTSYRLRHSLTPAAFASVLGVRPALLRQWERGAAVPNMRQFLKLLDTLHARADSLLIYEDWHKLPRRRRRDAVDAAPSADVTAAGVS